MQMSAAGPVGQQLADQGLDNTPAFLGRARWEAGPLYLAAQVPSTCCVAGGEGTKADWGCCVSSTFPHCGGLPGQPPRPLRISTKHATLA